MRDAFSLSIFSVFLRWDYPLFSWILPPRSNHQSPPIFTSSFRLYHTRPQAIALAIDAGTFSLHQLHRAWKYPSSTTVLFYFSFFFCLFLYVSQSQFIHSLLSFAHMLSSLFIPPPKINLCFGRDRDESRKKQQCTSALRTTGKIISLKTTSVHEDDEGIDSRLGLLIFVPTPTAFPSNQIDTKSRSPTYF